MSRPRKNTAETPKNISLTDIKQTDEQFAERTKRRRKTQYGEAETTAEYDKPDFVKRTDDKKQECDVATVIDLCHIWSRPELFSGDFYVTDIDGKMKSVLEPGSRYKVIDHNPFWTRIVIGECEAFVLTQHISIGRGTL